MVFVPASFLHLPCLWCYLHKSFSRKDRNAFILECIHMESMRLPTHCCLPCLWCYRHTGLCRKDRMETAWGPDRPSWCSVLKGTKHTKLLCMLSNASNHTLLLSDWQNIIVLIFNFIYSI